MVVAGCSSTREYEIVLCGVSWLKIPFDSLKSSYGILVTFAVSFVQSKLLTIGTLCVQLVPKLIYLLITTKIYNKEEKS